MKVRKAAGIVLALVLFGGCVAAAAAGGSASDPLVSKSYLEGTYVPSVTAQIAARVSEKTADAYQSAESTLEAKAQAFLAQAGGSTAPAGVQALSQQDKVTFSTGSGLTVLNGTIKITYSGAVVDVTTGVEVPSGTVLSANHRYLAAEDTTATALVASSSASVVMQGTCVVTESAAEPLPFTDILATDWYYEDVCFVYEQKLYQGTTASTFTPGGAMTRGMMATVLYRLAGSPSVSGSGTVFRDVPESSYYASAIRWASQTGLVEGYPDGTFLPDIAITREQLATLMYRYAKEYAKLTANAEGDLSFFPDCAGVSDWAVEGLQWAVGQKLVEGTEIGLQPSGQATRAQVAAILHRFSSLR